MKPIRKIAPIKGYSFVGVSFDIGIVNSVDMEYGLIKLPIRTNKDNAPSDIGGGKRRRGVVVSKSIPVKVRIVKPVIINICLLVNYASGEISDSGSINILLRIVNNKSPALALAVSLLCNISSLNICKNTKPLVFKVGGVFYPMIARETFLVRYWQVCNSHHFGCGRFFRCGIRTARQRENKDKKQGKRPNPN